MRGVQDQVEVFEDKVTITPKGVLGFLNKGLKGTKEIPFHSITAIQFKEAGLMFNGYIQFTIQGGNESTKGIYKATSDENTIMFAKKDNTLVIKIKEHIDSEIRKLKVPQVNQSISLSDELQKIADLKAQGILSDDEFLAAKKRLIG
jgi:hypothetical protein